MWDRDLLKTLPDLRVPDLVWGLGIGAVVGPLLGYEGQLARRQVCRRPTRTGLTIGVLYMAMLTGIGLGTTIINNVNDVKRWYRQTLAGDFFVRANGKIPRYSSRPG